MSCLSSTGQYKRSVAPTSMLSSQSIHLSQSTVAVSRHSDVTMVHTEVGMEPLGHCPHSTKTCTRPTTIHLSRCATCSRVSYIWIATQKSLDVLALAGGAYWGFRPTLHLMQSEHEQRPTAGLDGMKTSVSILASLLCMKAERISTQVDF